MVLGAIIVVEGATGDKNATAAPSMALVEGPVGCVEVLGRSAVERTVERFQAAEVKVVSVIVDAATFHWMPPFRSSFDNMKVQAAQDPWSAASQMLKDYAENGVDYAFISAVSAYTECDLIDFFWFHRGSRRAVTRAFDRAGVLDLWIATCAKAQQEGFALLPEGEQGGISASYFISRYVSRLASARDISRFVEDGLSGKCELRPSGREIRPGVWVDDEAQIHRRARIVAPAFVGRKTKVCEDTVVTRFSSVEGCCYIDYGTVIERSSVLADSYVGIWLDITHSIVNGNKLLNLERDIVLEILDASVIRENVGSRRTVRGEAGAPVASPLAAPSAESIPGSC